MPFRGFDEANNLFNSQLLTGEYSERDLYYGSNVDWDVLNHLREFSYFYSNNNILCNKAPYLTDAATILNSSNFLNEWLAENPPEDEGYLTPPFITTIQNEKLFRKTTTKSLIDTGLTIDWAIMSQNLLDMRSFGIAAIKESGLLVVVTKRGNLYLDKLLNGSIVHPDTLDNYLPPNMSHTERATAKGLVNKHLPVGQLDTLNVLKVFKDCFNVDTDLSRIAFTVNSKTI